MSNFLEDALAKEGLKLTDEIILIRHSVLKDIPIKLTVNVPHDVILMHPFTMGKILNSKELTAVDSHIDIIKNKEFYETA